MSDQRDQLQQAGAGALALSDALSTVRQIITASSCTSVAEVVTETVDALMSHQDIDGCELSIRARAMANSGPETGTRRSSGMPQALSTWLATEVFPAMIEGPGVYRESFLHQRVKEWQGCVLAVPIRNAGEVIGSLAIWNQRLNHFLAWHETLLEMIAEVLLLALSCQPAEHRQPGDEAAADNQAVHTPASGSRTSALSRNQIRGADPLTGLADRQAFEARLQEISAIPMAAIGPRFVLYLDIDRFRLIREYGGHVTADLVVRTLAEVLKLEADTELALGRLGMDEFGVAVERRSSEQVIAMADALVDQVDKFRMTFAGQRFHVSISIGVAELDARRASVTIALQQAKSACRAAQALGGGAVQVYHEHLVGRTGARNDGWMLNQLTHALKNEGLELHAQLISPLGSEAEVRLPHMHELLLRLRDENGEVSSAGTFLPVAERYGLSMKLDRWVIQSAFRQIAEAPFANNSQHRFTLNLSGHSIDNHGLLNFIMQQFEASCLPPERICFEVTETTAITDIPAAKEFIVALQDIGCRFALDDFGSGHSSFLYLRDLPVDYLKIDGELVREIVNDPVSLSFVRTIEGVGRLMGRRTIAEYVQSKEIYDLIGAIGCDYVQGYWVGDPVPLAELLSKPGG